MCLFCSVIVVVIGRWSELSACWVFQVVFCASGAEIVVMSGEVGCWCCVRFLVNGRRVCV